MSYNSFDTIKYLHILFRKAMEEVLNKIKEGNKQNRPQIIKNNIDKRYELAE